MQIDVLLLNTISLWIITHSVFISFVELSFFTILTILTAYAVIRFLCLEPQSTSRIETVLGANPRRRMRDVSNFMLKVTNPPDGILNGFHGDSYLARRAACCKSIENTLSAIRKCSDYGCKLVHVDVRLTSDGFAVLYKNEKITCPNDGAVRNIEEMTLDQVSRIKLFSQDGIKEEHIPLLRDAISLCLDLRIKMLVNFIHKDYYNNSADIVTLLEDLWKEFPTFMDEMAISSANVFALYTIRKRWPDLPAILWFEPFYYNDISVPWLRNLSTDKAFHFVRDTVNFAYYYLFQGFFYKILGVSAVILPKDIVTTHVLDSWEVKNVRVVIYPVNLGFEKSYYSGCLAVTFMTDVLTT